MLRLLNLLLIAVLIVLGTTVLPPWQIRSPETADIPDSLPLNPERQQRSPDAHAFSLMIPTKASTATDWSSEDAPRSAYDIIVEKDLMHPSRRPERARPIAKPAPTQTANPAIKKAPSSQRPLIKNPPPHRARTRIERLALQGVVLVGDYQRALIANLRRKPREPHILAVGDTIGRYTVKEIFEDRVVLVDGKDVRTLEFFANDRLHRRSHLVTPTKSAPVRAKRTRASR